MNQLLLLITIISLSACLSKKEQVLEPSPVAPVTKTKSLENTFDYSGELALKQIKVPILHSRDTITIQIYPIRRIFAVWEFLEERQLSEKRTGANNYLYCTTKVSTFKKFNHEIPSLENLNPHHIQIKLDNNIIDISKGAKWSIKRDHFEITIHNPHLKGAELIIENKTIEVIYDKKIDIRACANTYNLRYTKKVEGKKRDKPEYYIFDYRIS